MLPKKHRVLSAQFEDVLKYGAWYHSPHLTFRLLSSTQSGGPRFAVSVSKKVAKKAVSRNLLKRRVFSVVRSVLVKVHPSSRGAFFLKKGAEAVSFASLSEEILGLLKKSGTLS